MRFFLRPPRAWPTVGLALAAGLLVGDCLFVVSPYMNAYHTGSLWTLLLGALAMYALLCAGVDWAVQWIVPGDLGRSIWVRGGAVIAAGTALTLAAGEVRSLPLFVVAAIFALLALGRFTWPAAAAAVAFALYPTVVSPAQLATPPPVAAVPAPGAAAARPSFVVVVLDTLRRDHASAYGYARDTTPNLARLAERGIRFDRAYTTGCWSLPSHASLFTGLFAIRHGAHNENLALDERHPTLAEILARHGYETASFTGNPWIGPGTGTSRGFERNHESWRAYFIDLLLLGKRVYAALVAPDRDKGGAESVAAIRRWLSRRDPTRPYFLFVNVFEAHSPYQHVPREFRRRFTDGDRSLRDLEAIGTRVATATENGNRLTDADAAVGLDLFDGAIAAADSVLGQVLDLVGGDPIVVALADHGELSGEHTLFGHSYTLYEPLIRIPMVMAGGSLPRGAVVEEVVSLTDVMPTLLALASIPAPESDGTDLRPLLDGDGTLAARAVQADQYRPGTAGRGWVRHRPDAAEHLFARKRAVVTRGLKRVVAEDGTDVGFDLIADPGEESPFAGSETRLAASVPEPDAAPSPATLDPAQRRMLEFLGYLQ